MTKQNQILRESRGNQQRITMQVVEVRNLLNELAKVAPFGQHNHLNLIRSRISKIDTEARKTFDSIVELENEIVTAQDNLKGQ